MELVEHRDNLKRGREDSVCYYAYCQDVQWSFRHKN